MSQKVIFFIACCLFASYLMAADHSKQLQRLSPDEGLSQSSVSQTIQDHLGYIWIGTSLGLNRSDGHTISLFPGPDGIFNTESITKLFIDQQQNLWVSTLFSGLFKINPETLAVTHVYTGKLHPENSYFDTVNTLLNSKQGDMWLGVGKHLVKLNIQSGKLKTYFTLNSDEQIVRDLLLDKHWLYIATSEGLYRLNTFTNEVNHIEHRPIHIKINELNNNVKRLFKGNKQQLLVGTVEGLFSISIENDGSNQIENNQELIQKLNIWDLHANEQGYFVATEQGLFQYNKQQRTLEYLLKFSQSRFDVTEDSILDIFEDRSGLLWLASRVQGVFTWSKSTMLFERITAFDKPKLSHDLIWSFYQDETGYLWVGTENGLNKVNLKTDDNEVYLFNPDPKAISGSHSIFTIFKAEPGFLWLVTANGLRKFDITKGTTSLPYYDQAAKSLLAKEKTYGIFLIKPDVFAFFGMYNYYIYDAQTGQINPIPNLLQYTAPELASAFIKPLQQNTLLLSVSGHLYQYNLETQKVKLIYKVKNYQKQIYHYVDNWARDNHGILWLTVSGEGLIGLDDTTYKEKYRFSNANGLLTNDIYSVIADNNKLWLSSQSGLYSLNLDNHHFEMFSVKDGVSANEFNGYAVLKLIDGRLAYGSTRGITLFDPDDFEMTSSSHTNLGVDITNVSLISKSLNYTPALFKQSPLELNHDDYGLEISFSSFNYKYINKVHYQVELNGKQKMSFNNLKTNKISFSKLEAGAYTLSVNAIDPKSGIKSKTTHLDIVIHHAWWSSHPAKVFYIILAISSFSFIYSRRHKQQKILQKAHETVLKSQQQTSLALKCSKSGIWSYQRDLDLVYDTRVSEELGYKTFKNSHSSETHLGLIHPEDKKKLIPLWKKFMSGEIEFWEVTYRMKNAQNQWLWYSDNGKVVSFDDNNKPTYFSGTYTNITETKANELQAKIYGDAFSQINDCLLILDEKKYPITANKAFLDSFNIKKNKNKIMIKPFLDALSKNEKTAYYDILNDLKPGEKWQGEAIITSKTQHKHPFLISINAIASINNKERYFVIVLSDLTEQKKSEEKLKKLANFDHLTKLPNRALMRDRIDHAIHQAHSQTYSVSLFFIDLDKFKQVNDLFGHNIGDKLLCIITNKLTDLISENNSVGRQSGDEFLILIEEEHSPEDLTHLALKINQVLTETITISGRMINISASIGIAVYPFDAQNSEDLICNADIAMIQAKQAGRNNFRFFTEAMNARAKERLLLETDLQIAFKEEQLVNYYQPIVNTQKKIICGVELLLRWPKSNTMISPGIFIPIAEEIGLIIDITEQAIHRALKELTSHFSNNQNFYLSINLSAIHILSSNLTLSLLNILEQYKIPTNQIRLEITEGILMEDKTKAIKQLQALKTAGFKLFLDDFGTGYSSLTYLNQFKIDVIKIDQSFVNAIGQNPVNESIIKTILTLAKNLNIYCVAEGVETKAQIKFLNQHGCVNLQGFYYSRPVPASELFDNEHIETVKRKIKEV